MARIDIEDLQRRARDGDLDALNVLGKALLLGEGATQSVAAGVRLTNEAAAQGQPEALTRRALLAAWGVEQPRDIDAALDDLLRAACCGWTAAQRQLQLLARSVTGDWQALREAIELQALTRAPALRVISHHPLVAVADRFATAAECEWLIELGRPTLRRAQVYHGSATPQAAESRTNSETGFTIGNADVFLSLLRDRMASATSVATNRFEVTKLLHYTVGQQFALHSDFLASHTQDLRKEIERRGQRAITLLVFLNDDYEGGATEFPRIGLRFRGKQGDALIFRNIDGAGAPDYDSVHAGLPVERGEKWVLSQWMRTKQIV
jgi:prolyl 4-hydroxylase